MKIKSLCNLCLSVDAAQEFVRQDAETSMAKRRKDIARIRLIRNSVLTLSSVKESIHCNTMYHLCIQGRPNRQTLMLQNRTMEIAMWQSIRYHRFWWSLRSESTVFLIFCLTWCKWGVMQLHLILTGSNPFILLIKSVSLIVLRNNADARHYIIYAKEIAHIHARYTLKIMTCWTGFTCILLVKPHFQR